MNAGRARLEVGAGASPVLRGTGIVFVDCYDDALDAARAAAPSNTYVLACVGRPLPLPPATFDRIVSVSFPWPALDAGAKRRAVEDFHTLLAPGGSLYILGRLRLDWVRRWLRGVVGAALRVFGRADVHWVETESYSGVVCHRRT